MAKKFKKMDREELKEFKNGKYMGGPEEERAEKKKKGKRMADGGMAGPMVGNRGFRSRRMPGEAGRPAGPIGMGGSGGDIGEGASYGQGSGRKMKLAPTVASRVGAGMGAAMMRGGGLARKGVGQALAKGGMVKGAGCVKRGIKKAKSY